jgi:hypothetical protein
VSSKKTPAGTVVHMHLAKPLVVGGVTLANAGTPATMKVIATRAASAPDVDGAVQVDIQPLELPGHGPLPLTLTRSYITVDQTGGQQATRGVTDVVEDILIPGAFIAQAFRKGRELVLPVGTTVRTRSGASIDVSHAPAVVIATPAPFQLNTDVPHAGFTPIPLFTQPTPPPRPTAAPKPTPAASGTVAPAR